MSELRRDSINNRIISYIDQRASENTGQLEIPVIDERFLSNDFNFIVKTEFSSLREAVNAEKTVANQINAIQTSLLRGVPLSNLSTYDMDNIKNIAKNELLQDLKNISENNPESNTALQNKINELQDIIDNQRNQLTDWATAQDRWNEKVFLWSQAYEDQSIRADAFERINIELSSQQEQILTDLKTQIDNQAETQKIQFKALDERTGNVLEQLGKDVDSLRKFKSEFIAENSVGLSKMSEIIAKEYFGTAGTAGTAGQG
jgi:hypothetical protein